MEPSGMNIFIQRLKVTGLYDRFDLEVEFAEGVNVVYGINGSGKTALLHILTNAANLDLERFTALRFRSVTLEVSNGTLIEYRAVPWSENRNFAAVTLYINDEEVAIWPSGQDEAEPREQWDALLEQLHRHREHCSVEAAYLPAFRTMFEAGPFLDMAEIASRRTYPIRNFPGRNHGAGFMFYPPRSRKDPVTDEFARQTALSRWIFGEFVPWIESPSPRIITALVDHEIQRAVNRLASGDGTLLANVFIRVLKAMRQEGTTERQDARSPEGIRADIRKQLEQIQAKQHEYGLADNGHALEDLKTLLDSLQFRGQNRDDSTMRALRVFEAVLSKRHENLSTAFDTVRRYIDAVNELLEAKQLVTAPTPEIGSTPQLQIRHSDGTLNQLELFSSGEKQIAGLVYAASHMTEGNVVLVDEPELSLHINWQRSLIEAMVKQLPPKQLIVCTHSPTIASGYRDQMIELLPRPTT